MMNTDSELDATGLNCPLPILKTKKALAGLQSGQTLRIIATDPGAVKDFEAFSRHGKHELLESREDQGKYYFVMKKA